jgi:hypothetical protein
MFIQWALVRVAMNFGIQKITGLASNRLASQRGLCCMEYGVSFIIDIIINSNNSNFRG